MASSRSAAVAAATSSEFVIMAYRIGEIGRPVIGARADLSSPPVGGGASTCAPMTGEAAVPTVVGVKFPAELPLRPLGGQRTPLLRLWGMFALSVIVVSI